MELKVWSCGNNRATGVEIIQIGRRRAELWALEIRHIFCKKSQIWVWKEAHGAGHVSAGSQGLVDHVDQLGHVAQVVCKEGQEIFPDAALVLSDKMPKSGFNNIEFTDFYE